MPYCKTCNKLFNSLGIARHRAIHRDKKEDCTIEMSDGTFTWHYSIPKEKSRA